jgi:hypothetical protein
MNNKKGKKLVKLWVTEIQLKGLKEDFEFIDKIESSEICNIEDCSQGCNAESKIIQILFNSYKERLFELR